uniref:Si:ch211-262h13.5 n=1 Tax=Amphilophus citrinellus TaxID=61819 RepID=A0A3Q0RWS1_AMPCI
MSACTKLIGILLSADKNNCFELAPIPCNDKAVEKLSRLAVTYINEDRIEGYKFALNRVANVHLHAQGPAGNVYYLDLEVLETKCHTGSKKPWKRCDVRPFMETQISGNCNTTILHTPEGYSYLYSYDCALVPDPPEKLQQTCPTCPLLLSVDSPEAMNAAWVTLASYKRKSTLAAGLGVKKITRAAAQYPSISQKYIIKCLISFSQTAGFCTGSVHGDMNVDPDAQTSCEMFKPVPSDPPTAVQPVPVDPSVAVDPAVHLSSSSSESAEGLVTGSLDSSSEEIGGPVALRPPFNFRYQRRDRKKRQALMETSPSYHPIFLSDFPSGPSPFRSCPGPARYTTV